MKDLQDRMERLRARLHDDAPQRRLAVAAFAFRALACHEQWGFARVADYVRARVGVPLSTWYDWVSAGRLLAANPSTAQAFSFSALALLGRHLRPDQLDPSLATHSVPELRAIIRSRAPADSEHPNDPNHVKVRLRLPRSAALYCEETLRLARALCGGDLPDDEAVMAVLAEASTEITPAEARALPSHPTRRARAPSLPEPSRADALCALEALAIDAEEAAVRLDEALRAEQSSCDARRRVLEDRLLDLTNDRAPAALGYRTLDDFFERGLGLASSTGYEMLRRARLRRRRDPLACADLPAVATVLLEQLRALGVPPSAMHPWIDEARNVTVRQLRRAILWAQSRSREDQLSWAFDDYRPPTNAELQTSERPLHEMLADSARPNLNALASEPTRSLEFVLQTEHAQLLAQLTQGLAQQQPDTPRWWSLLGVFHQARSAWETNVEPSRHRFAPVLERDHYRCQAPECSAQRGLEVHHVHYRSHGGSDDAENLITLCAWHHKRGEHGDRLRVRGRVTADREALHWELGRGNDGLPLLRYRGERLMPPPQPSTVPRARAAEAGSSIDRKPLQVPLPRRPPVREVALGSTEPPAAHSQT